MDLRSLLLVAAGGALGAVLRYGVSLLASNPTFPWPTLAVNLLGSFILGALLLPGDLSTGARLFLAVGVLGAFTTLSTFSVETIAMLRAGHEGLAALNVLGNSVGGPLAAWAGWKLFG